MSNKKIIPLSQRDKRWGSKKLGFSDVTISGYGCTITSLAMMAGLTPDKVNEILKASGGYAQENLVIWNKVSVIPNLTFNYRYYTYENAKVKQIIDTDGACLVEVDGKPIGGYRHWLLYIGNKQLIDPWDGQIKSTNSYVPISFVDISINRTMSSSPTLTEKQIKDLQTDSNNWKYLRQKYDISDVKQMDGKIQSYEKQIEKLEKELLDAHHDFKTASEDLVKLKGSSEAIEAQLRTELKIVQEAKDKCLAELSKCDDIADWHSEKTVLEKQLSQCVKKNELLAKKPTLQTATLSQLVTQLINKLWK
jgi:hypothetical protein